MKTIKDFKTFNEQRTNPEKPIIRLRYRKTDSPFCNFEMFSTLKEARERFLSIKNEIDFMDIYDITTYLCLDSFDRKTHFMTRFEEFLQDDSQLKH